MKIKFARIIVNKSQLDWDWSGSITSLKNALREKIELEDTPIFYDWRMTLNKYLIRFGIKKDDLNVLNINRAEKKLKGNTTPLITFDEFPKGPYSYIYQDLIIDYLINLSKNDVTLFEYSGFSKISMENLVKRHKMQADFYASGASIFTMSHWLKNYILSNNLMPADKVHYVGAGININSDAIDYSQKRGNKFLFIGKDFHRKAGHLVIEAFQLLQSEIPESELYIIGPSMIETDNLGSNIIFLGELESGEVTKYFNLCDYFVMPSHFEAFGLVFIEALTFGLPCIGRNVHEMPYLIENKKTGLLLEKEEDNPKILADLMKSVYKNKIMVENVQTKREFYIDHYSWSKVADRMISVIEKI